MPTRFKVLVVSEFLRKLRGGSQPILVRANDGLLYVLKFAHNLQGPNLLFNEGMGAELYRAFGLPVPEWRPLLLTDSFLDRNPACWFEAEGESIRPVAGLCFGSRFLAAGEDSLLEILPGSHFARVTNRKAFGLAWLIDICAQHSDNRQALFLRQPGGDLLATFIDHGSMFGGPRGCDQPHPVAPRYLDPRIYCCDLLDGFRHVSSMLNASKLWNLLRALPTEWHSESALARFSYCVARLTDPASVRQVIDSIADLYRRTIFCEPTGRQSVDRFHTAVLCAGISNAATSRDAAA